MKKLDKDTIKKLMENKTLSLRDGTIPKIVEECSSLDVGEGLEVDHVGSKHSYLTNRLAKLLAGKVFKVKSVKKDNKTYVWRML